MLEVISGLIHAHRTDARTSLALFRSSILSPCACALYSVRNGRFMEQLLATSVEWARAGEDADARVHPDPTLLLMPGKARRQ